MKDVNFLILLLFMSARYVQELNIDLENQQKQKQMMLKGTDEKYGYVTNFIHSYISTNLKNDVINKLTSLIDNISAIKIFNYLLNNQLINVFLECFENLVEINSYHDITLQELINYVINYSKNTADMLDYLKEELDDLLMVKFNKSDITLLTDMTDDIKLKEKLSKIKQDINIVQKKMTTSKSSEILQELINNIELLPFSNEDDENIILNGINEYYDKVIKQKSDIGIKTENENILDNINKYYDELIPAPFGALDDEDIQEVEPPLKSDPTVINLIRERRKKSQILEAKAMAEEDVMSKLMRKEELRNQKQKQKEQEKLMGKEKIRIRRKDSQIDEAKLMGKEDKRFKPTLRYSV
jgi:hypothetical protein